MKVFSIAKGFHGLWKRTLKEELSENERNRLRAITLWQRSLDMELVCETFGISRATPYRWAKQYDPKDLNSLKEISRRPHHVRKHQWSRELIQAVKNLRIQYPRWRKDKLVILLKTTRAGRFGIHSRPYPYRLEEKRATCGTGEEDYIFKKKGETFLCNTKAKKISCSQSGDLVEIDTLDIRPFPSIIWKQFTARDVVSRWDVLEVRSTASAKTAREFLSTLETRMPFPVKAIQVDGGSEFFAEFEDACKEKNILLYVLPPKSPKLNGHVERANRTHTEEFYEVCPTSWTITEVNRELKDWENVYNRIRPHQSLHYKTPLQFLKDCGILSADDPSVLYHM